MTAPAATDTALPQPSVTTRDYHEYAETYLEPILGNPLAHGIYAPRHGLQALAAYHFTGDRRYAEALLLALRGYDQAIRKQIADEGGVTYSWEGPYLWGLILRRLREDNLLTAQDEALARDLFLLMAERITSWSPTLNFTRGQQHRAQGEAAARALAAHWYPDAPQAEAWKRYADTVWDDWWRFRDVGINDTGYFYGALQRIMLTAELLGRTEVFTAPEMQPFWERLMYEVAPDGSTIPYGASSGWNSAVGDRILALELAAKYTRDGRYRWVAHRAFNYLRARGDNLRKHHHIFATTVEPIALAAVLADDGIPPVQPDSGSRVLYRKEVTRLTDAQAAEQYPGYGILDCNMGMTQRVMPHKIIFRSGWDPGDLFMMVEAFPRHDPLNPTAILGLNHHGSAMTMMASEKFVSRENNVQIEDPTKAATFCGVPANPADRALPTGYAGMETTVESFTDNPLITHACLAVTNYMGYEVEHTREILFVKNRFVLVRDRSRFAESFPCRMGPVWNTGEITSPRGLNWVNCYLPCAASLPPASFENPRWDLLVVHSPREGRRIETWKREEELVAYSVPYATRYTWEGTPQVGDVVQFSWLLLPHDPAVDPAALAEGVRFVRDEPETVALRIADGEQIQWAVLNGQGREIALDGGLRTDARLLYLDCVGDSCVRYWASAATFLQVGGTEVFRAAHRTESASK